MAIDSPNIIKWLSEQTDAQQCIKLFRSRGERDMCGIVGITSTNQFSAKDLIGSLKRLEYRGYDSFGFATNGGHVEKFVGEIRDDIISDVSSSTAISHCRWATHGSVTQLNAHPHADCTGKLFIVHNGIISNYVGLRQKLADHGHKFLSQTDSEVIAHFFEEELKTKTIENAVVEFFSHTEGEFSVLLVRKNDNKIYAFKRGSPLVLGVGKGNNILASDIYAFSGKTNHAVFFNENEFAVVSPDNYEFYRYSNGGLVKQVKEIMAFKTPVAESKEKFEHYMLKEITEEPEAARRLINSLNTDQHDELIKLKAMIESSKRVVFVAAGTSYHASLLGVYFLNKAGIEAHTIIASEFRNFTLLDENTLVIAISQSGETMDVIEALHGIKAKGVKIASLVNVPYSTIQRMSNASINIMAGQEVCVAATKTFVNQAMALLQLSSIFGYKTEMDKIPELIEKLMEQKEKIANIAKELKDKKDIYILGRGFSYPVAREIALKLKEISYIHSEGMMGGELKHGTLALIEQGTPVISLMPDGDEHILSNTKEVEARGGRIIAISNNHHENYETIKIPADGKASFSILATVVGQLLTYYIAKEKGLPIDKPRNLAKTCTTR